MHAGAFSASKTKSFDEDKSHVIRESHMLSPENRNRYTPRSLHHGIDVTDLLKPKTHLRQKSETDFLDKEQHKSDMDNSANERVSTSYVSDECRGSLDELTEAVTRDVERHGEEQRTDNSRSSDSNEKTNRRIKRHHSLTSITSPVITKTPPAARRKGALQQQLSDNSDYHIEGGSLLSPVKATPSVTTSSPMADIINALTNEE